MRLIELKTVSFGAFLTTGEAAQELDIKESVVRNYLSSGKFTTYKFKTLTLLDVNEVREWKQARRKH